MNKAFTRLIWKEHRAQRSLWLALLLGCAGIFVLMRLEASPWLDSLLTASSFCILFVVAATAIAFAGEVDDRTVILLRMLPCRTSTLMMAKLTAIITGCIALFLALAVLSGVFEIIGLAFPAIWRTDGLHLSFTKGELVLFFAGIAIFSFFTFACTVVASMVSKRVISAVGLAAALTLGTRLYVIPLFVVAAVLRPLSEQNVTTVGGLVCLCMSLVVAALSRPWHLGRIPRELRISPVATSRSTSRFSSMMPRTVAVLKRVIAWPMSQSRVRAALFWCECRSAIPFAATWLLIGIVICVGRYAAYSHIYFWPALFLLVFMHECGQRTMRADQRSGSILLLANLGVSPASIWLTKTLTWFAVLAFVGTVVVLLDSVIPSPHGDHTTFGQELRILQIISGVRAPHVANSSDFTRNATSVDLSLQISTCVAYMLMTFVIGQLTACWIQRQILAYAASVMLLLGTLLWMRACVKADYSLWVAVIPVGLCYLLATLCTARQWIDRTVTWKLRLVQGAWIILPCFLFFGAGRMVWYLEPRMNSSMGNRTLRYDMDERNPTLKANLELLNKALSTPTSDWKNLDISSDKQIWQRFAHELMASRYKDRLTPPRTGWLSGHDKTLPLDVIGDEEYFGAGELLRVFAEQHSANPEWPLLPISWTAPWSNTAAPTVTILLLADATEREKQSDVVGAVQQHVRAIRLSRSLANQTSSWNNWTACVASEQAALENLRLLLGSADLRSVDLENVFNELSDLLIFSKTTGHGQTLDPRIMLRRRMHFWGLAAYHEKTISEIHGESIDLDAFAGSMSTVSELEEKLKSMGAATRRRAFETMYLSLLIQNTELSEMNPGGRVGLSEHYDTSVEASVLSASQAVQRFAATSTIGDLNDDPTMISDRLDPRLFPATVNLIAEERATLITILLHRHRLVHGRFPDSLMELADGTETVSMLLTDPWSGTPFFYAPKGLPKPIRLGFENEQYRIAAGQPLLFSAGRFARPLHQYLQDSPRQEGEPYSVATLPPNLILFIGLDDRVERFPLQNRVLEIRNVASATAPSDALASETMSGEETEKPRSNLEDSMPQPVLN